MNGLFKKYKKKMETATFHITTLNVLILTLIYFIIAGADTSLMYLCVNSVLENKGIHLWYKTCFYVVCHILTEKVVAQRGRMGLS